MSWASLFPDELLRRPTGLVLLSGLDTEHNSVHQAVWVAFSSNRKSDRVPLKFKLHNSDEFPKSKPKRPTYDWYIPKGILKSGWMKKHLEVVPSLVVLFFDYDWNDPMWKEKQMECSEKIKIARESLAGRSTKVCILLIQKSIPLPPGEDVIATERASSLCTACDLLNKLLFVLPVTEHLLGYTVRLEHVFSDLSRTYYHSEARKTKTHKDFLNKTTHALLFVRHQFKIAFLNELKHDSNTALKHYKQAYSYILELRFLDFNILEIKTVAGFVSYKICKLSFSHNTPLDAISQFRKHIDFFKNKMGVPELAFEHSAWMSKQFQVFGDIFDEAIKQGLTAISTQHPGIYYQQAGHHTMTRRSLSQSICQSALLQTDSDLVEALSNLDYYGQRPWRQGHQSIEPPDTNKEKEGILVLQYLEKQINYSKIIIPLLCNAIAQTKKYKSPRMKRHLTVQLLNENYNANDFSKALSLLSRVTWEYRRERWWNILTSILTVALRCAYLACNVEEYVSAAMELIGVYGLLQKEEKIKLQNNLVHILEGVCPGETIDGKEELVKSASSTWKCFMESKEKKEFVIDMSNFYSFIECKVQFSKEIFQADDVIHVRVFLRSTAPMTITFKSLRLKFRNDYYNSSCILKSKRSPGKLEPSSNGDGSTNDPSITSSSCDPSGKDENEGVLTLEPGRVRVANFKFISMICDVGGSIEVTSLILTLGSLGEEGCEENEEVEKPQFFLKWSRPNLEHRAPATYLQKNFFPYSSRKTDALWQSIRPDPIVKVVQRKFRLKVDIIHDSPGFVGEMLKFKISITNKEINRVINVRCNIMLDPNMIPEVKNSSTLYTEASKKDTNTTTNNSTDEVILVQKNPIYVELTERLEKNETVEGCFYTHTTVRGKLVIMVGVCYDMAISMLESGTECRCMENMQITVKILDPLDISVDILSPKNEKLDFAVNVGQPFLALTNLKNLVGSPIEIIDTKVELNEKVELLDDIESCLLAGELLNHNEIASENFCLSLKQSVHQSSTNQTIPLGKYVVYMRRANSPTSDTTIPMSLPSMAEFQMPATKDLKYTKVFSKFIDLPVVGFALRPLMVDLELPSCGVMYSVMEVTYTISNVSHVVQEILVTLESTEGFMFSGHKQAHLRVLPLSKNQLNYNFVPLAPGNVVLPKLKISSERFPNNELDSHLEKILPTSIFVKPKTRVRGEGREDS